MDSENVYYRFEDFLQGSGGYDMSGEWEPGPSTLRVRVVTFDIVRKTPKGAWINGPEGEELVLDHWHKKFANPTRDGAKKDFIARKRRLIAVQERRVRDARLAIATAEKDVMDKVGLFGPTGNLKTVHSWELELLK